MTRGVLIPGPLRSYTEARQVTATGSTLGEVLADLDRQFPGLRFRVVDEQGELRRHVRFFVGGEQVLGLGAPLDAGSDLVIVQALSGG
jgi:molybdopterin converting factor small subunit